MAQSQSEDIGFREFCRAACDMFGIRVSEHMLTVCAHNAECRRVDETATIDQHADTIDIEPDELAPC